ncbi:MAG: hypothetical protein ACPLKQ_06450 [Candidatus Bathyarchaeales archaeon]
MPKLRSTLRRIWLKTAAATEVAIIPSDNIKWEVATVGCGLLATAGTV